MYSQPYNQTILLGRNNEDFLIDDNGLDWGEVESELSTISSIDGYGATLNAVNTNITRVINITGWIVGTEAQMKARKNTLSRIISPHSNIRITVTINQESYYIDTIPTKAVRFSQDHRENNEKMCKFTCTLQAPYPFFQHRKSFSGSETELSVQNLGSIPVGVRLQLTLSASITNPYVSLYRNGTQWGYMGLNGTFEANTNIVFDSERGNKRVEVNGVRSFSALNENSDWLLIPVCEDEEEIDVVIPENSAITIFDFKEAYNVLEDL